MSAGAGIGEGAARPRAVAARRGPTLGRGWLAPQWMIVWLVVGFFAAVELITRLGLVPPTLLVPPSEMIAGIWQAVVGGTFIPDFVRSMSELVASAAIAIVLGIPIGMIFWKLPVLGKMFEPYMVGMYAVPLVIFYPFALAIMGLGSGPVIVIAAAMGLVPIVLNSWAAFSEVPDIYFRVSRAFGCHGWQRFRKVTLPAAAPLVFAGLKLGVVYAFIGVIVMEFITASVGLGFRVAYYYDSFKARAMYAYILVILILAVAITAALIRGERRVRGGAE